MSEAASSEPLFLERGDGYRFAMLHLPAGLCRAAVLYLHPFAEEMNKARRMAALQAQALAAHGVAVLLLDLHGCGDSSGEFHDASWDSWLDDAAHASAWLRQHSGRPVTLWGLRLGALLALAAARRDPAIAGLLLWQPVLDGAVHLTQFLRLRVAGDMLGGPEGAAAAGGTAALRAALARGDILEVAGYALAPALARGMDGARAADAVPHCPVRWLEVASSPERALAPASLRVLEGWRAAGADARLAQIVGEPFWATQEIAECPALLEATVNELAALANAASCHA